MVGRHLIKPLLAILLLFGGLCFSSAQQLNPLESIDSLIAADRFETAKSKIASELKEGKTNIGRLVYPTGKIEFLRNNATTFEKAQALLESILEKNSQDSLAYEALLGMGLLHVDQGTVVMANERVLAANTIANALEDEKRIMESEFHLSEIGLKLGDFNQLMVRTENALQQIKKYPNIKFPLAPRVYNYKASLMHFMAQPDSANLYFEKALSSIPNTKGTPENRYYLPGTIYGNWFLVKQTAGDYEAAMDVTLKCIQHFNLFLTNTNNHPLTQKVHGNLTIAYRNLGSLYNDLGDKEKAKQVASLAYHHAKKHFLPNTVQYFSAMLMMAEAHLYSINLERARQFLEEASSSLYSIPGDNYSYKGNFHNVYGDLEYKEGNYDQAVVHYQKTISANRDGGVGNYGQNEVFALLNLSQAYANTGDFQKAEALLDETLEQVKTLYGPNSFLANTALINQIKLGYKKQDYAGVVALCEQLLADQEAMPGNSIYARISQSEILLFLARATYANTGEKTLEHLMAVDKILEKATLALEQHKSLITSAEGVANLIEYNRGVFGFAKKINLELFELTKDQSYLDKVITLHESSIYNRIRTRLNLTEHHLAPDPVRATEDRLRTKLNSFFEADGETQFDVSEWNDVSSEWTRYLDTLQQNFPEYYQMRYASILQPLDQIKEHIGNTTTLVRYFFVEGSLYAYVLNQEHGKLVNLGAKIDWECIGKASDYRTTEQDLLACSKSLYDQLWKPLEKEIRHKDVVIFPDRELFNLSFEILTPDAIGTYSDLAEKGLLANHNISYNYSLMLLQNQSEILQFESDFVAFVPEFDKRMKANYQMAISDSVHLDKAYLTLLPQPFSMDLAKKFGKRFDGRTFFKERASKQLFSQAAKEHKIIHIGTHAQSNNVNPELSRLVFAKNISDSLHINDNYLYTYEIYNQNLSSNLAILTACETGKPTYQPGEGMISLAHAFNYAGSQSILTSLWEIDEASSSQILASFYEHLADGKSKDAALRLAKLDYLRVAEGRTLHPQYWAGLVLMGDPQPLSLNKPKSQLLWMAAVALLLILVFFWWKKGKASA